MLGQTNPVPFLTQPLVPASIPSGSAGFSITLNGTGFAADSVVKWNGVALSTTFMSKSSLTAHIPASDVTAVQTASVTVFSPAPGGGTSNSVPFTVTVPTSSLTFSASTINVGANPANIVTADFNNDGKPDLAVVNEDQLNSCYTYNGAGTISILLGNGDGTFTNKSTLCFPNTLAVVGIPPMVVGDFNGDGKQDLVVSYSNPDIFNDASIIFVGNGDGTFTQGSNVVSGFDKLFAEINGDFNRDGKLDLAIPFQDQFGGTNISIPLGNGDGTFDDSLVAYDCTTSNQCFPADSVVAGDFNGDGILDLAAVWSTGSSGLPAITILLGKGDGTFTPAKSQPSAALSSPTSITTGDFDGDGKLDLAIADASSGRLIILHGNGDGTFKQVHGQPTCDACNYVATADLNGDGKLDLVSLGGGNTVEIFLGKGDGKFQPGLTEGVGNGAQAVAFADFNGDGRLDIAAVNSTDGTVSILLQDPDPQASPAAPRFGQQPVGVTSSPMPVSLSNTGSAPMVMTGTQISGDYQIQSNQCTSPVAPAAECNVAITFTPTAPGTRNGLLTFSYKGANSPLTVPLTGTGQYQAPAITTNPINQTVTTGTIVQFSAAATGDPEPTVQWQVSTNGGRKFSNILGATSATLTFAATDAMSGYEYRAAFTNGAGIATTIVATLTVQDFTISLLPAAQTVLPGHPAIYAVWLKSTHGLTGNVALSCSGAPQHSTCAVWPNSVNLNDVAIAAGYLWASPSASLGTFTLTFTGKLNNLTHSTSARLTIK
jgi:hypothetical protein